MLRDRFGVVWVLGFAADRRLYGGRVLDLPHARTTLAEAYADLARHRILTRLVPSHEPTPREAIDAAFDDLLDRARNARAFDLAAGRIPRRPIE